MATHSIIPAWRIPWTEEPGELQSMGSQSWTQLIRYVGHNFISNKITSFFALFTGILDLPTTILSTKKKKKEKL